MSNAEYEEKIKDLSKKLEDLQEFHTIIVKPRIIYGDIIGVEVVSDVITHVILKDIDSAGLQVRNIKANDLGEVTAFCFSK